MSAWTNLGLPLANRAGYTYAKDLRLVRSPYESALPDQKQLSNPGKKTFKVSWDLTPEQVNIATLYLLNQGFNWFQIELISEEGLTLHEVRLVEKFETTPISGRYYKLSITAETRIDPVTCTPITCDTENSFDPEDVFPCGPEPPVIRDIEIESEDKFRTRGWVPEAQILTNVTILPTGPYPLEATDEFTSRGWLVEGWQYAVQIEGFSAGVSIIEGEKVPIYLDVFHTQYPEAFSANVNIVSGEKVWIYADVFHDQYPESYGVNMAIISGRKVGIDIQAIMPPDEITSTGWLTDGEFTE